jgi:LmbE family N-acetylglucosaminyl deacetylase
MSVLVVAAHPDDETIGAGASLAGFRDVCVLHLTNGAPRDRRWISQRFTGSAEEYAATRAAEARAALALAGVRDVRCLACADQEAIHHVRALAADIGKVIEELRPQAVITHAYEGGHPDHDACALCVGQALMPVPPPVLLEMPLYHARNGALVAGEFADGREGIACELDEAQRALKQRMFDCYQTQLDVLSHFPIARERFRVALPYDFSRPPHDGPLWYEIAGFPMSGETWRRLACR